MAQQESCPRWRLGIEIGKKTSSQRLCFGLSNGSKFRSWLYYHPSCVAFSKWFNLLKVRLPRESQMWVLLCGLPSFSGDLEGLVYRSEASHRLLYIKPPQTQVSPQTLLTQNPRNGTRASIFLKVPHRNAPERLPYSVVRQESFGPYHLFFCLRCGYAEWCSSSHFVLMRWLCRWMPLAKDGRIEIQKELGILMIIVELLFQPCTIYLWSSYYMRRNSTPPFVKKNLFIWLPQVLVVA